MSNELGAGDAPAAKQAVVSVVSLSATQALVISSVLLSLRHQWAWLFSGDAEVVDSVAEILPFVACIALLDGIQGVLSGMLCVYDCVCVCVISFVFPDNHKES